MNEAPATRGSPSSLWSAALQLLRSWWWLGAVVLSYWGLHYLFVSRSQHRGLLFESASGSASMIALGLIVVVLRLVLLFVVPGVVTYQLMRRVVVRRSQ